MLGMPVEDLDTHSSNDARLELSHRITARLGAEDRRVEGSAQVKWVWLRIRGQ